MRAMLVSRGGRTRLPIQPGRRGGQVGKGLQLQVFFALLGFLALDFRQLGVASDPSLSHRVRIASD